MSSGLADTEVVDLLGGHEPSTAWLASEAAQVILSDTALRTRLYRAIHPAPTIRHTELLRALLAHEVAFRRQDGDADSASPDDASENLYWCALLLHQVGAVEDVLPLWRAKHTNFDTGAGLDVQFLVGAGLEATLASLESTDAPDAAAAHKYLSECRDAGDFDDLNGWLTWRRGYFT